MGDPDQGEHSEERQEALEGLFDPQLSFPAPFVEAPQPLTTIIKRDGSEVPFDKHKIADAILNADQTVGGSDRDRAESLASAVTIYLAKKLNGQTPTSDQVDDAVERVLINMGHTNTALAYVRHRDRRARVQRLRQGDTRAILSEWAEALGSRDVAPTAPKGSLFVRTSSERLATWDRARIAEALVRETGLDKDLANVIALEVEQQVVAANVKTLTTSLLRELVDAKLIEHGLEEYRRRHMRLGVPLYDAERIICGRGSGDVRDPETTSRVLAESVKREFALSQVLASEEGDAHLRGDMHVHDLGRVDRLHSSVQSLEYIARFGVGLPDSRTFSRPPKYPETLLAQMVNSSMVMGNHFAGTVAWDALNLFFAPFLQELDGRGMRQLAQMLIYEYAYRAVTHGERAPLSDIRICWDVPHCLKDIEAVGPGGKPTGLTYGEYAYTAQDFASALFDVFKEGGVRGRPFPAPAPVVRITEGFFKTPGHDGFLEHAAEVAALRGNVHFEFVREEEDRPAFQPWEPREVVVQRVTLNVPRAAHQAGDEEALAAELERLLEVAVRAHIQKREFVQKLLSLKDLGPLGLLAVERNGRPYLDMDRAAYIVGLTGLNEAAQSLLDRQLHESNEAVDLAQRLVARLEKRCREWRERTGLRCVLATTADATVSERFATLDLETFPDDPPKTVKTDPQTHEIFYTHGVAVNRSAAISPIERVRIEGRLHEALCGGATTVVRMPDTQTSGKSVADFIRKTYHLTRCRRVVLVE